MRSSREDDQLYCSLLLWDHEARPQSHMEIYYTVTKNDRFQFQASVFLQTQCKNNVLFTYTHCSLDTSKTLLQHHPSGPHPFFPYNQTRTNNHRIPARDLPLKVPLTRLSSQPDSRLQSLCDDPCQIAFSFLITECRVRPREECQ